MTTATQPPAQLPVTPTTPASRRRLWRWVAGAVALIGVVGLILLTGTERSSIALDPKNPGSDGAQALAEVVGDQGIEVQVVRSLADLQASPIDSQTTLVVTSTSALGTASLDTLDGLNPGSLILVDPPDSASSQFGADFRNRDYEEDLTSARCQGSDLQDRFDDLRIDPDGEVGEWNSPNGCFFGDHGALLAEPRPGVLLLGAPGVMSNDRIDQADNAALALRLLGSHPRLVWYVADPTDRAAGEARSLESLLPPWIRPALWLIACAVIAMIIWRARRLGRLISEPLPVSIVAIESTRSHGRLYRKAGDRAHAASALRLHACAQIARQLALGRYSPAETSSVVAAAARQTNRPVAELDYLLNPDAPAPDTDADLITLANSLQALTEEVHQR